MGEKWVRPFHSKCCIVAQLRPNWHDPAFLQPCFDQLGIQLWARNKPSFPQKAFVKNTRQNIVFLGDNAAIAQPPLQVAPTPSAASNHPTEDNHPMLCCAAMVHNHQNHSPLSSQIISKTLSAVALNHPTNWGQPPHAQNQCCNNTPHV